VACTFEAYLNGNLKIPGQEIEYRIKDAVIVAYENENPALEDLSQGRGVNWFVMTLLPKASAAGPTRSNSGRAGTVCLRL
jgi:hypothetical protein